MRPATLAELAARLGKTVPPDLAFAPGMGLAAALAKFEFTLSCIQNPAEVSRVAGEMCEDAEHDGVGTLEIRFARPLLASVPGMLFLNAALLALVWTWALGPG